MSLFTWLWQDLRLKEEGRELIYKGALKKQGDSSELQVFLFDHALLLVKAKSKVELYKVYRRVCRFAIRVSLRLIEPPADPSRTASRLRTRRLPIRQAAQGPRKAEVAEERTSRPGHPYEGIKGRLLDHLRASRAQVLPDHSGGEHVCQPAEMGGEHTEAARLDARKESGL